MGDHMPSPGWRLEFSGYREPNIPTWNTFSWDLKDAAQKLRVSCRGKTSECKKEVNDFTQAGMQSTLLEYANKLSEERKSYKLSKELAAPVFDFLGDLLYQYGRNLHRCKIEVIQDIPASRVPPRKARSVHRGAFRIRKLAEGETYPQPSTPRGVSPTCWGWSCPCCW